MMKKIFLLAAVLVLSLAFFVGCGKDQPSVDSTTPDSSVTTPDAGDTTTNLDGTLEDLMASVYAGVKSELPAVGNVVVAADTSKYYIGLDTLDNVQEALVSEAMIGSIPHSIGLIRVKDGVDVETVKEEIRAGVDPRKWICVGVEPEQVIVENIGNVILLVIDDMAPQEFLDSFNALK